MSEKTHNLVLVNHPQGQDRRDFEEIAIKIEVIAPGIKCTIVPHDMSLEDADMPPDIWARPTLTVAFQWPEKFRPQRGVFYAGRPINKHEQMRKFAKAQVPIPTTVAYEFGSVLDPSVWGDFVVMKPTRFDLTSHGDAVFLMRTESVAQLAAQVFPPDHLARAEPVLIQRFVDTGEFSESFRVLTLFGAPLYCMKLRRRSARVPLYGRPEEILNIQVASTAQNDYQHIMVMDADVIALAKMAAAAMPAIPLQGIDIIREAKTGKLFVLENNAGGNTWHFSSHMSLEGRAELSREKRIAQFGAWDIAAKVLAARVLNEAT